MLQKGLTWTLCLVSLQLLIAASESVPAVLTAGNYVDDDVVIPEEGSEADVSTMLRNATESDFTEALLQLTNPVFDGTLTITLPATASTWTTTQTSKSLRVRIINGTSSTTKLPGIHINISGVLSLGSSISIEGGTYFYADKFIAIPSGLTIQDGSSIAINKVAYYPQRPPVDVNVEGYTYFIYCGAPLTILNSSRLTLSNIRGQVAGMSVEKDYGWHVILVKGNTLVSASTDPGAAKSKSEPSIILSNKGAFTISNNKMTISNLVVEDSLYVYTLYTRPIGIFESSALTLTNNLLSMTNVQVGAIMTLSTIESNGDDTQTVINSSSTLSISHNVVSITDVSVGSLSWYDVTLATFMLEGGGTSVSYFNNIFKVSNLTTVKMCSWSLFRSTSSALPIALQSGSSVALTNNQMQVVSSKLDSWYYYIFQVESSLQIIEETSRFKIDDNTMQVADVSIDLVLYLYILSIKFEVVLDTFTTLSISDNVVLFNSVSVDSVLNNLFTALKSEVNTTMKNDSNMTISNNEMKWAGVYHLKSTSQSMVFLEGSIESEGIIYMMGNSYSRDGFTSVLLSFPTGTTLVGNGGVAVLEKNSISSNTSSSSVVDASKATVDPSFTIRTCRNYINGALCSGSVTLDSCLLGSLGNVFQCTSTNTFTTGMTPSHTLQQTASLTTSMTLTRSGTIVATPSNTVTVHYTSMSYSIGSSTKSVLRSASLNLTLSATLTPSPFITPTSSPNKSPTATLPMTTSNTPSPSEFRYTASSSITNPSPTQSPTTSSPHTLSGAHSSTHPHSVTISTSLTQRSASNTQSPSLQSVTASRTQGTPSTIVTASRTVSLSSSNATPSSTTSTSPSTTHNYTASPSLSTTTVRSTTSSVLLHTPTGSITPSTTLLPHPPIGAACNFSCADIITIRNIDEGSGDAVISPYQAIDDYLSTYLPTDVHRGCTALSLPFSATYNGKVARLLLHVVSLTAMNVSYPVIGSYFETTHNGGSVEVVGTLTNFSSSGLVVVVDVRRTDTSPTTSISSSVGFPRGPFMCVPTNQQLSQHLGLPWINIKLGAPPTPLTQGERAAVAAGAMASSDLQTVAAVGLLRCSPGSDNDVETEAGIRALVPMALSGTCTGAVQGALLAILAASLLSVSVMCGVKRFKSLSWLEAAAITRCPGLVIAVWAFVQMGLVVCGARLVTAEEHITDVGLGIVGVVVGAILPVVSIGLAWGVVSRRCYRYAQVPEAVTGRSKLVVWARSVLLPSYELDVDTYPVSKAFSTIVGRTRRPSCVWAGLSAIQPVVLLLVVFAKGESCNVFLIVAGVGLMIAGALCHVIFRPNRIMAVNYLHGVAMALNAAVLFIASKLVGDPLNGAALTANAIIAMIQVALSVGRLVHTLFYIIYMRLYGASVLAICTPEGKMLLGPNNKTPPTPVFDIRCSLCVGLDRTKVYESAHHALPLLHTANCNNHLHITTPPMTFHNLKAKVTPNNSPPSIRPQEEKGRGSTEEVNVEKEDMATTTTTKTSSPPINTHPLSRLVDTDTATKTFTWNPKEYVPMERPYTMLYEEDFAPSDDVQMDDIATMIHTPSSYERKSKSNRSVSSLLLMDDLGSPHQSPPERMGSFGGLVASFHSNNSILLGSRYRRSNRRTAADTTTTGIKEKNSKAQTHQSDKHSDEDVL